MKILVIDDNPAFRYSLAGALGKGGYQVVMADDGEHGLAVFRKEHPDLVICDLIMPRRNGVDTIQQIRRESPAMKIIAISGSGCDDECRRPGDGARKRRQRCDRKAVRFRGPAEPGDPSPRHLDKKPSGRACGRAGGLLGNRPMQRRRAAAAAQCTRSSSVGTGRSSSAVERAIQHQTTQVNSSSPPFSRSASRSAIATASLPCRLTNNRAASQILRSLVIIMIVNPPGGVQFHGNDRPVNRCLSLPNMLLFCSPTDTASCLHARQALL